jgi:hypothetical protein
MIRYEILIEEHLADHWSEWLEGMEMRYSPNNETILTGALADQAALFGVLMKLHNLGLTLVEVRRADPDEMRPIPAARASPPR